MNKNNEILQKAIDRAREMFPDGDVEFSHWLEYEVGFKKNEENSINAMESSRALLLAHNTLYEIKKAWDEDIDGPWSDFVDGLGFTEAESKEFAEVYDFGPSWEKEM